MNLESISKEYFSNLNALAEKIAADIENTQEAYQDLWRSLSKPEQSQAIDESIINPSAVIKYANLPVQASLQNYNSYSWFTKSQLNLYSKLDLMGYPSGKVICRNDADQISKEIVPTDKELKVVNGSLHKSKSSLASTKTTDEKPKSQKSSVLKPKTPPPPPPPKISAAPQVDPEINESETGVDIPKTGFDFLDNW